MNMIDRLIEKIIQTKNPTVVGLDPTVSKIPSCYKSNCKEGSVSAVAEMFFEYGCSIIDTVAPYVPAVKPQIAFYEAYGSDGMRAFEKTIDYARSKDLIVIEDSKRNDIGHTASAYADGHLGEVELVNGGFAPVFDVDFMTISPFLGSESIRPFVSRCYERNKGIFVLVRTSNLSAGEIQNCRTIEGQTVSQMLALQVTEYAKDKIGAFGYSPIGAVVGATYPKEARVLREMMPHSYFLVPGYGAQGGCAEDVIHCFDDQGLGALVNSSRGILYSHMTDQRRAECSKEMYLKQVQNATVEMKNALYCALKKSKQKLMY